MDPQAPSASTTDDTAPAAPEWRDRWLAAVAYLGPGFLVPTLMRVDVPFVRWHAAQGFVLFFVEAIAIAAAIVVDSTLGQIPWLGLIVMLALRVGLVVAFLAIAAVGVVKTLAGERFELPVLARYAQHVPGATSGRH